MIFITLTSTGSVFFAVFLQKKDPKLIVQITDAIPSQLKKKILLPKKYTLPTEITEGITFVESAFNLSFTDKINFCVTEDNTSVLQVTLAVKPKIIAICLGSDEFMQNCVMSWFNNFANFNFIQTSSILPNAKYIPKDIHLILVDEHTPKEFLARIKSNSPSTKIVLIHDSIPSPISEKYVDQIMALNSLSLLKHM